MPFQGYIVTLSREKFSYQIKMLNFAAQKIEITN